MDQPNRSESDQHQTIQTGSSFWKAWLALIFLAIVWGSSFILIKKSLVAFSPIQVASLRIAISGLTFVPFLLWGWARIDWKRFRYIVIVGFCGSAIPAFLFSYAQASISSAMAGILNSLTPLFTFLLGISLFGLGFSWPKLFGVALGLGGALVLIFMRNTDVSGEVIPALLVILAAICYATSVNTVGAFLKQMDALLISAVAFCLILPIGLVGIGTSNFLEVLSNHPHGWASLAYVSILSIVGTAIASILFFQMVKWSNALFASTTAYLIPIVAIGWAYLDGEVIYWATILGLLFILSGIYLTKK